MKALRISVAAMFALSVLSGCSAFPDDTPRARKSSKPRPIRAY